jgi:serine/threonine protein kinase
LLKSKIVAFHLHNHFSFQRRADELALMSELKGIMRLLEDGQMIRDRYEVERFLGEGAFAEVYRVKHRFLGRQAMKVFKRVGMNLDEIQDMLGEAILLTHLKHPNIISVSDANIFETPNGTCGYFTMEHVPGGSLDKFWRSHGGQFVPVETAIDLVKQVCRGITQAHREKPPIIHRDIKPQNILVGYEADGLRARVSDFGLAKKVNPLTLLATAAGTLAFKPPEAFAERKGDSCAADVWAIGATLYLLLTDRPSPSSRSKTRGYFASIQDCLTVTTISRLAPKHYSNQLARHSCRPKKNLEWRWLDMLKTNLPLGLGQSQEARLPLDSFVPSG